MQNYGKKLSSDDLIKIIADAEDQLRRLSCFVAGTLVHTKESLRPIEEIKIGDYVLSKPESSVGETSYKQVVNTFEYEDREVWYLNYYVLDENMDYHQEEYLVTTAGHPFWVKGIFAHAHGLGDGKRELIVTGQHPLWVKTVDLYGYLNSETVN